MSLSSSSVVPVLGQDCQAKVLILGPARSDYFVGSQLGPGRIAEIYTLVGEILSREKHTPGTNALLGETLSWETQAPGTNALLGETLSWETHALGRNNAPGRTRSPETHAPGRESPRNFAVPGVRRVLSQFAGFGAQDEN
jgi:hypothetical protein